MPEYAILAKRLKEARQARKMDQISFSEEIGISREEISLIECQKTDPKLSTMKKVASGLGITVSEMLNTTEGEDRH